MRCDVMRCDAGVVRRGRGKKDRCVLRVVVSKQGRSRGRTWADVGGRGHSAKVQVDLCQSWAHSTLSTLSASRLQRDRLVDDPATRANEGTYTYRSSSKLLGSDNDWVPFWAFHLTYTSARTSSTCTPTCTFTFTFAGSCRRTSTGAHAGTCAGILGDG